jgi:peptide/nickel transport system substrate-binding protein
MSIPSGDILTYGPFAISEAQTDKVTAVKNEGHPAADQINFDQVGWPLLQDPQAVWQALDTGRIDGHVRFNIPDDVALQFPDNVEFTTYRSYGGFALAFNLDGDVVGDPKVRRALGFVVDKQGVIRNVGATTREQVNYNTGIPPGQEDRFIDTDKFTEYSTDHERATQMLKEAGFTQEDGDWYRPNGERFGPTIKTGSTGGSDLIAAQTVANQFRRFGIDTRLQSMEGPAFESSVWETSDFEIAGHGWGAAYPEPFAIYNNPFRWNRENVNIPEVVELPPVGDHDGDPGAISFNAVDDLQDLTGATGDELRELMTNYAWAWEHLNPWFQVFESFNQTWFTSDDWEYPDLDSDIMQRRFYTPLHYILKTGEFKARTE